MTNRERAIVGAFTGVLMGEFSAMHEYIEEAVGRPVQASEMGTRAVADEIKEATRADFLTLCGDDRVILSAS